MREPDRTGDEGLADRPLASMAAAVDWVDAAMPRLAAESVPLADARDRVLAEDCRAGRAMPERDRAALDGFAVRAQETIGAGAYNPLAVAAAMVAAGDPLPAGMDAVVPLDAAEPEGAGGVLVVEPMAPGENVEHQGAVAAAGAILAPSGTRIAVRHIGLLAAAGIGEVAAVRRPRVSIMLFELARSQRVCDGNRPMIRAAIERDGGMVVDEIVLERRRAVLAAALAASRADIALVIGGTGAGHEDQAASALTEAGWLALHGVAMRPGETTGFGRTEGGVPVVLLPGAPAACLWCYELFAGRAIRRLGGHDPDLPFRRRRMIAARKIVSAVGIAEICPVRFGEAPDTVEPLPSFAEIGLRAATAGDGFTIMPEESEGCPSGAAVTVHLYQPH